MTQQESYALYPIVALVLREPVQFGPRDAKRFFLKSHKRAQDVAGGLQGSHAEAVTTEMWWAQYGHSVVLVGTLGGPGAAREQFRIVVALGPGDRVELGELPKIPPEPDTKGKPPKG